MHARLFAIPVALVLFISCNSLDKTKNSSNTSAQKKILFRDSIPPASGYVNDYVSLFTPAQKDTLSDIIKYFEQRTTGQIAIVIFDTTMLNRDSIKVLTQKVGNAWGVGQKEKNNGVVIGICPGYRRMSINVGTGIEKYLSEFEAHQIIRSEEHTSE